MSVLPAPGTVSFARGVPPAEVLPVEALAACAERVVRRHGDVALNYGRPEGYGPLREWIGDRHGVSAERILVTPGSLLGLHLLVAELAQAGSPVAVEVPAYDRFLRVLAGHGVPVTPVARGSLPGAPAAALYVMPTFHNPTGATMALADREALAEHAIAHGTTVIEDDPYGELRFEGERLPTLHALLEARGAGERAVHASSFSKSVAPGLRVGYLVLPERLVAPLRARALDTYVSPPLLPQAHLIEFLEAGLLEPQLQRARAALQARRDALLAGLAEHMGGAARWTHPAGGYFSWLELEGGLRARDLLTAARRAGTDFVPGDGFFPGAGGEAAMRLSFSAPAPDAIGEGIAALAAVVRQARAAL